MFRTRLWSNSTMALNICAYIVLPKSGLKGSSSHFPLMDRCWMIFILGLVLIDSAKKTVRQGQISGSQLLVLVDVSASPRSSHWLQPQSCW